MVVEGSYKVHSFIYCIDDYKFPPKDEEWLPCPNCKLKPKIWIFNNGRSTACGCWNTKYHHFAVNAESIMSVHKRLKGDVSKYKWTSLRENWNHWVRTGEILFEHAGNRKDGRW